MNNRFAMAVVAAALTVLVSKSALAAEGGAGVYLLGKRGPLAAFLPKPGWYVTDDVYYYDASSDDCLPLGDRIAQDADAQALLNIAPFTWITDSALGNGRLGFSAVIPYGRLEVKGRGAVFLPDGTEIARGIKDSDTGFGDPTVAASLGWKHRDGERFRAWSGYSSVTIPVGDYETGRLANLGKNRWALDVGGAYTLANFGTGREFSSVAGITFNGENRDNDYETGTELHFEAAVIQHFPRNWSAGLVGYYYKQLTGDDGADAKFGDFKGRVWALGAQAGYQFPWERHPLGVNLRWYREFDARNRLEGDSLFLTFSVPLRVRPPRTADEQDWDSPTDGLLVE